MKREPLAVALSLPLRVHAFRYVALQVFPAEKFGFDISNSTASEIAWGDVASAVLALAALWMLRESVRRALLLVWVFVVVASLDLVNATIGGIREQALATAHDLTWVILTIKVPLLWVTLALVVWQLVSGRGEAINTSVEPFRGRGEAEGLPLSKE
jgi:hypothetical protein